MPLAVACKTGTEQRRAQDTRARLIIGNLVGIKGLKKDQLQIRPGPSSVLKLMSRTVPQFSLNQISKPVDAMHANPRLYREWQGRCSCTHLR